MTKPITWSQLPAKVLADVVEFCDGHSILPPDTFVEVGVPAELVALHTRTHISDRNHYKSTIFDAYGKPLDSLKGVSCLHLLEQISKELGLPPSLREGRGFRAQDLRSRILEHLGVKS